MSNFSNAWQKKNRAVFSLGSKQPEKLRSDYSLKYETNSYDVTEIKLREEALYKVTSLLA